MAAGGVFDRLRQPEYTGENRCLPCTGVNLVIAAVLTVAVGAGAVAAGATGPQAFVAGAAVFACAAGAVYLRGYLVPGTPWLTETYFPDWVLRWFDKDTTTTTVGPPGTADATGPGPGEEDVEATLQRLGAIEECVDSADLCLTGGSGRPGASGWPTRGRGRCHGRTWRASSTPTRTRSLSATGETPSRRGSTACSPASGSPAPPCSRT